MSPSPTRRQLVRDIQRFKQDLGLTDDRADADDSLRVIIRQDRVDEDGNIVEEHQRVIEL